MGNPAQEEKWTDPYLREIKRREKSGDRTAKVLGVAVAILFFAWFNSTNAWLVCEMRQQVSGGCYQPCDRYVETGLADLGGSWMCV